MARRATKVAKLGGGRVPKKNLRRTRTAQTNLIPKPELLPADQQRVARLNLQEAKVPRPRAKRATKRLNANRKRFTLFGFNAFSNNR